MTGTPSSPAELAADPISDTDPTDPIDSQPVAEPLASSEPTPHRPSGAFKAFLSTFITILLAELGDKTQLTTLLMSAESHSPWIVFLGAGTALIATSLLGVLVGRWLSTRVSARTIETAAGATLLLIAVLLLWDMTHL